MAPAQASGETANRRFGLNENGAGGAGLDRSARRDRHDRQDDQHSHHRKDLKTANAENRQHVLRQCHRAEIDKTVDCKCPCPVVVGHLRVDPTFDIGKQRGKADPGDKPHQEPEERIDDHDHGERGTGSDRGHGCKGPDVPGASEQPRCHPAADDEAEIVSRAGEPDDRGGKPFRRAAQRDQSALQAVACQKHAGGDQEREKRAKRMHCGPDERLAFANPYMELSGPSP